LSLGQLPEDTSKLGKTETREGLLGGLTIAPLSPSLRNKFQIPERITHGVVVTGLDPGGRAQHGRLRTGDVILEINRKKVDSVEAFNKTYRASGDRILLLVYRQGSTFYLVLGT
jgi:S1-C subfamily serine protease